MAMVFVAIQLGVIGEASLHGTFSPQRFHQKPKSTPFRRRKRIYAFADLFLDYYSKHWLQYSHFLATCQGGSQVFVKIYGNNIKIRCPSLAVMKHPNIWHVFCIYPQYG